MKLDSTHPTAAISKINFLLVQCNLVTVKNMTCRAASKVKWGAPGILDSSVIPDENFFILNAQSTTNVICFKNT